MAISKSNRFEGQSHSTDRFDQFVSCQWQVNMVLGHHTHKRWKPPQKSLSIPKCAEWQQHGESVRFVAFERACTVHIQCMFSSLLLWIWRHVAGRASNTMPLKGTNRIKRRRRPLSTLFDNVSTRRPRSFAKTSSICTQIKYFIILNALEAIGLCSLCVRVCVQHRSTTIIKVHLRRKHLITYSNHLRVHI